MNAALTPIHHRLPSAVRHLPSAIRHLSSAIRHPLYGYLPYATCPKASLP